MRTPEHILDNYKPMSEYPSYYHESQIIEAMQEHAIEFAEWILKEGWRKYEEVSMYYNEPPTAGKQTYFSMKEVHQVYLKSIEK